MSKSTNKKFQSYFAKFSEVNLQEIFLTLTQCCMYQSLQLGISTLIDCVRGTRTQPLICFGCSVIIGCPVQLIREVFSRLHLSSTHICLTLRRLLTFCLTLTGSVFVELSSKAFNNLSKVLLRIKPSYFQYGSSLSLENVCDSWCTHQ